MEEEGLSTWLGTVLWSTYQPLSKDRPPKKSAESQTKWGQNAINASIYGLGENQVKRQNMFQRQESRTSQYIAHNHWIIHSFTHSANT